MDSRQTGTVRPTRGFYRPAAGVCPRHRVCRGVVSGCAATVRQVIDLTQFPEPRRVALLFRYALDLDYAGVQDLVAASVDRPCPWHWSIDATQWAAVLGDDGRYHLRAGPDALHCGDGWSRCMVNPDGRAVHQQYCTWWSYRTRSALHPPATHPARDRGHRSRTVRWTLRLNQTGRPPETVPYGQRCPTNTRPWPAFHDPATRMGRIRIQLTAELGRFCHACRRGPAFAVDHDHFTGLVRGMLCRVCNSHVDHCPHLSDCPYADYLNNPPAAPLQLTFPQSRGNKPSARDLLRIERLGFNPFTAAAAV